MIGLTKAKNKSKYLCTRVEEQHYVVYMYVHMYVCICSYVNKYMYGVNVYVNLLMWAGERERERERVLDSRLVIEELDITHSYNCFMWKDTSSS